MLWQSDYLQSDTQPQRQAREMLLGMFHYDLEPQKHLFFANLFNLFNFGATQGHTWVTQLAKA